MSTVVGDHYSRGAQLLELWRATRAQKDVVDALGLDTASYSRFENGVRRPPSEAMFRIEAKTCGEVPAKSWLEPADAKLEKRLHRLREERAAA